MCKRPRSTGRLILLALVLALGMALQTVAWAEMPAPPVTVTFPNIYNAPGMKTRYTNGEAVIRVRPVGFDPVEISLSDLSPRPEEAGTSAALVRGVAARLIRGGRPASASSID